MSGKPARKTSKELSCVKIFRIFPSFFLLTHRCRVVSNIWAKNTRLGAPLVSRVLGVLACILAALIPPSPKLETTRGLFVEAPRLTREGDPVEVVHHVWRQSCLFFYFRTSLMYALIECLKNSDSNVRKVSVIIPFPLC